MPIALLNFSSDLLGEVFMLCNPFELYCLSRCSQRVRHIVKSRKPRNWKLYCAPSRTIVVGCRHNYYKFKETRNPKDRYTIDKKKQRMLIEFRNRNFIDSLDNMLETFGYSILECVHYPGYRDFLKFSKIAIEKRIEIKSFYMSDHVSDENEFFDSLALTNQLNVSEEIFIERNMRPKSTRFPFHTIS
ncbi:unnamed protein product [Caenorhabditis nigoni]